MLGYMCNRCLSIHDEVPKRFYKDDDGDSEVWICPKCGDEDVVEVTLCEECLTIGEFVPVYEGFALCLAHEQEFGDKRLTETIKEIAKAGGRRA